LKFIFIFLYVLSIVLANVLTAKFNPLNLFIFFIPIGTFFIGLTFLLRDFLQNEIGKNKTYFMILVGLFFSAITSFLLGDPLNIFFASLLTFLISESIDTEIFSRLKKSLNKRILISGFFSSFFDSLIFVIIGLSPIGVNFLQWNEIYLAILGQFFIKFIIQFLFILIKKLVNYVRMPIEEVE
jgi:uncharacterized PurR-regulated membrane protein YhhQ (DUF165 family)